MRLDALYYYDGERRIELPMWCHFFMELGEYIGSAGTDSKLVIGMTLPVRAYSSCLVALGIINSAYERVCTDFTLDDHFKSLCALEIGTPMVYLDGDRHKMGLFDGCEDVGGETAIRILIRERDSYTQVLTRDLSGQALVAETQIESISDRQIGHKLYSSSRFITSFLKGTPEEFIAKASYEALIIGQVNTLRREIVETQFGIQDENGNIYPGRLQDILRVRKFMGAKEAYWTDVGPTSKSYADEQIPQVVIFDGTNAFLRHSHIFKDSHWIILMEYTDTDFEAGVNAITQRYVQYRIGTPELDFSRVASSDYGIEIMAFKERSQ